MAYPTQRRDVAIVGIKEYPLRVVRPGTTANHIRIESARVALEDASLTWQDVDGYRAEGSAGPRASVGSPS